MDFETIRIEQEGRVAVLTLNRPESGNTVTDPAMIDELERGVGSLCSGGETSVMIVTGRDKIFSAGGDVKAMRDRTGMFAGEPVEVYENYRNSVQRITRLMAGLDLVTIAAVNGHAIGAGCDLAVMCDLRIAAKKARFSQAFVNLGLVPGDGGAWFLARAVPRHVAAELVFTGKTIDGEEAYRLGLVNEVVEDDELLDRARDLAADIARKPPAALRLSKRLLNRASEVSLAEFLDISAAYQSFLHQTEDHHEALAALFEKRPGEFTGR